MTEDFEACRQLDPIVTPYVDGELPPADRARVDDHVRVCGACRSRVAVERGVRELIQTRKTALLEERASAALRERCARVVTNDRRPATAEPRWPIWRARLAPLALAASLILLVGGAFVYQLTARSSRVMAAELTADH